MALDVLVEIHQLDRQIDPLRRRVGGFRRVDVFLTQERFLALDEDMRAVISIGDDRGADDESFAGAEFNLESHRVTVA